MRKYILSAIVLASVALTACNDYLDVVPKNNVQTVENMFEQRDDAYQWLMTCYSMYEKEVAGFAEAPGYLGADEYVCGQYFRDRASASSSTNPDYGKSVFLADGVQLASNPYMNLWAKDRFYAAIRYCNIFIENCPNCHTISDSEKKIWIAEVKALKAHLYFELMRRYGPIVLVPKNIDVSNSYKEMLQSRSPIDSCVNAIVSLCDEAIVDLPSMQQQETSHYAYFNREAAATLKAYTLLYAASPLFNGNEQMASFTNRDGVRLFPDYDKEKWHRAAVAADEALQYCLVAGKKLYSGSNTRSTPLLNTILDIRESSLDWLYRNDEVILAFEKHGGGNGSVYRVPAFAQSYQSGAYYDRAVHGCFGASIKMVNMFYTENGLPMDEDKLWLSDPYRLSKEADSRYRDVVPLNTDVLTINRRREPRYYADLAPDGLYWVQPRRVSGALTDVALLVNSKRNGNLGVKINQINSTYAQNISGIWVKKGIIPSIALQNYTSSAGTNEEMVVFRLAEVYLMAAEAWNEYLDQPNEHVYDMIDAVRTRAGIPDVRTSWGTYAKHPENVNTKEGMRNIIRQEWNVEFAFEGRRFWNLRRWMTAAEELNSPQYGWNVLGTNNQTFYNNYDGPVVVWSKRKFVAPRDYFWPIRSEEVLVSGVVQNPGWGSNN